MSEFDKEQAGATADEAQDNETLDAEIELTPVPNWAPDTEEDYEMLSKYVFHG